MPKLHASKLGTVGEDFELWAGNTLSECYAKMDVEMPELVEVCLFEKEGYARAYLRDEKAKLGISTDLDETFPTSHDAWTGIPRISMCVESLNRMPMEVRIGALHHEAAHSILHGSIEYYLVNPYSLQDLVKTFRLPPAFTQSLVYLTSVAVKDYAATKLLYERGFIDDQVAFTTYFLEPSDEEMTSWAIASTSKAATTLFFASLMKSIACALPLSDDEKYREKINTCIVGYIDYLPTEQKKILLDVMGLFKTLTCSFQDDLKTVLKEILKVGFS